MKIVHPLLAAPTRLLLYLASTLVLGLLLTLLLAQWAGVGVAGVLTAGLPAGVLLGFGALTTWYVVRAVPHPGRDPFRAVTALGGTVMAGVVVWLLLTACWGWFVDRVTARTGTLALLGGAWPILLLVGVPVFGLALLLHYLLAALEGSQRAERRALEAVALAREAELASLRAQLAPHFLFNSLNSIASLTGSDPEAARDMCGSLAHFFRQSLALGAKERITLAEELSLVETYLAVERARFGKRLRVRVRVDDDLLNSVVPPLILQPLVENAIHHGIAHRLEGGTIEISAASSVEGRIHLEIENPCDPDRPSTRGQGVGLRNVRARLKTAFGREASLRTREEDDTFRVEMLLPEYETD